MAHTTTGISPALTDYVEARLAEAGEIAAARRNELEELAADLAERLTASPPVRLTFICTHNSRRSHLSQVWAQTAARWHGVSGIETFSGGTEATAFDPRAEWWDELRPYGPRDRAFFQGAD